MSGLFYYLGDADPQNYVDICMQKSNCKPQSGEVCCDPKINGAFCVDADGQFVSASACEAQMGEAAQCTQYPDKGSIIQFEYPKQGKEKVFTANMQLPKDDSQYDDYMQTFCTQKKIR